MPPSPCPSCWMRIDTHPMHSGTSKWCRAAWADCLSHRRVRRPGSAARHGCRRRARWRQARRLSPRRARRAQKPEADAVRGFAPCRAALGDWRKRPATVAPVRTLQRPAPAPSRRAPLTHLSLSLPASLELSPQADHHLKIALQVYPSAPQTARRTAHRHPQHPQRQHTAQVSIHACGF